MGLGGERCSPDVITHKGHWFYPQHVHTCIHVCGYEAVFKVVFFTYTVQLYFHTKKIKSGWLKCDVTGFT